jgi:putative hydrolase of the HAD superfamily
LGDPVEQNRPMTASSPSVRALLVDFYGTLARATTWVSADEVLDEHGYALDPEHRAIYFADGLDGVEHDEHSQSRDHYVAWQRARTLAMLAASDVHPDEYETIVEKLRAGTASRVLEAYPEVPAVLRAVRDRGIRIVICSNWDWDLREAVTESGLAHAVDAMVSSAWVGARKPHPRIFAAALAEAGVDPVEVLFVGDTWGPDVVGPIEAGFRPLYLRRDDHWPDSTAPPDPDGVAIGSDLTAVLDLLS